MAHDKFIYSLLIALISNRKRESMSSCVNEVSRNISDISGDNTVLMTVLLRILSLLIKRYKPSSNLPLLNSPAG